MSQNSNPLTKKEFNDTYKIYFHVPLEFETYFYYPSGILNVFEKLGGLLALLNISMAIEWLNKRWFKKEINKKLGDGKVAKDEAQKFKKPSDVDDLCSIECIHSILQRLDNLEQKSPNDKKNE